MSGSVALLGVSTGRPPGAALHLLYQWHCRARSPGETGSPDPSSVTPRMACLVASIETSPQCTQLSRRRHRSLGSAAAPAMVSLATPPRPAALMSAAAAAVVGQTSGCRLLCLPVPRRRPTHSLTQRSGERHGQTQRLRWPQLSERRMRCVLQQRSQAAASGILSAGTRRLGHSSSLRQPYVQAPPHSSSLRQPYV